MAAGPSSSFREIFHAQDANVFRVRRVHWPLRAKLARETRYTPFEITHARFLRPSANDIGQHIVSHTAERSMESIPHCVS